MKPTYNVFSDSKTIRNWGEDVHAEMFNDADVEIIETPSCFLRIRKADLTSPAYVKHIQSHFAIYRRNPNPRYRNAVQWSTKRGQWVNGATFSSPEEAIHNVRLLNARLIPFADSPYLAYKPSEVCDED